MTTRYTGGDAFPHSFYVEPLSKRPDGTVAVGREQHVYSGMSLRDWFAGQALAGKMSIDSIEFLSREDIADRCYRQADAMLAARGADQ